MLREAWAGGMVMCGLSAGSLCWFEQGLTAFHGEQGLPVAGIGVLMGSNAVHYDKEPRRRPDYQAAIAARDGAGLGGRRRRGAALRGAGALARGDLAPEGGRLPRGAGRATNAVETPLATEYLGAPVTLVA